MGLLAQLSSHQSHRVSDASKRAAHSRFVAAFDHLTTVVADARVVVRPYLTLAEDHDTLTTEHRTYMHAIAEGRTLLGDRFYQAIHSGAHEIAETAAASDRVSHEIHLLRASLNDPQAWEDTMDVDASDIAHIRHLEHLQHVHDQTVADIRRLEEELVAIEVYPILFEGQAGLDYFDELTTSFADAATAITESLQRLIDNASVTR